MITVSVCTQGRCHKRPECHSRSRPWAAKLPDIWQLFPNSQVLRDVQGSICSSCHRCTRKHLLNSHKCTSKHLLMLQMYKQASAHVVTDVQGSICSSYITDVQEGICWSCHGCTRMHLLKFSRMYMEASAHIVMDVQTSICSKPAPAQWQKTLCVLHSQYLFNCLQLSTKSFIQCFNVLHISNFNTNPPVGQAYISRPPASFFQTFYHWWSILG